MSKATVNGKAHPLSGGLTVVQFLERAGFGGGRVIVERNGEPLPTEKLASTKVSDGDRFEVVQLVGGG